ncbi:MAG: helix-turn-helix domain-containing protein [Nitriliruptorales bacterium]|nr:helix-turn-helix domain-containing protein [Nitriliruptorales bacterium]
MEQGKSRPQSRTGARLLRAARNSAGLSQAELARRAGTTQSSVSAYESGAKDLNVETLARLIAAADMRILAVPSERGEQGPPRAPIEGRLLGLLADRREQILRVAERHGASGVRVFGSVVRGEENADSDIDLLVDMAPGRSLLDEVRLVRELTQLLGVRVDVVTSGGLLDRDQHVLADAVSL